MTYTGWLLTDIDRGELLDIFPPTYPDVVAHHVTREFGIAPGTARPQDQRLLIVGHAARDGGEALVVSVAGRTKRPDGGVYHVTWSLDRAAGRKPVDSNALLAHGWDELPDWHLFMGFGFLAS